MRPDDRLLRLRTADHTLIMGILNVTADSFSDGGLYLEPRKAQEHGVALVRDGADIVDIGAESTRPGAHRVPEEQERQRVLRTIADLQADRGKTGKDVVMLSVDTTRASVAEAALNAGARIINDVSGGLADKRMMPLVAHSDCLYVLQHWRGRMPGASEVYPHGVDRDVLTELARRVAAAREAGIDDRQIILDPGLGFSKPGPVPNFTLLAHLERLTRLGFPVLVGASRKRFLSTALHTGDQNRLDEATAVISALAAEKGAWAVRVHDVARSRDALAIARQMGARPAVGRT